MPEAIAADHLSTLRRELDRCIALAGSVDLAAPIPHLGRWRARNVLSHLAGDFVWAIDIITTRTWNGDPLGNVPERGDALRRRFMELAEQMWDAALVAHDDPDAPCPNFALGDQGTLGWWVRHQAHETALHRWDLETAHGSHDPFEPAAAADAVDELLHVYTRRYGRQRLDRPITIGCRDQDAAWDITPTRRGRVDVTRNLSPATVHVDGDAEALLLVMWHRLDPDPAGLGFHEAEASARAFLAGPLTA